MFLTLDFFPGKLSKDYCEKLANNITSLDDLPAGCKAYGNVVDKVKAKSGAVDPFAGMAGGQAVSARTALSKGRGTSCFSRPLFCTRFVVCQLVALAIHLLLTDSSAPCCHIRHVVMPCLRPQIIRPFGFCHNNKLNCIAFFDP